MVLLAVLLWKMASTGGQSAREQEPSYTEFMAQVEKGNVREVTLYLSQVSAEVQGELRDPSSKFRVMVPREVTPDLTKQLRDKGVLIHVKEVSRSDWFTAAGSSTPIASATRRTVPNRLPSTGIECPAGRSNRIAGPPARSTRSQISVISSRGDTLAATRLSSPSASSRDRNSLRSA